MKKIWILFISTASLVVALFFQNCGEQDYAVKVTPTNTPWAFCQFNEYYDEAKKTCLPMVCTPHQVSSDNSKCPVIANGLSQKFCNSEGSGYETCKSQCNNKFKITEGGIQPNVHCEALPCENNATNAPECTVCDETYFAVNDGQGFHCERDLCTANEIQVCPGEVIPYGKITKTCASDGSSFGACTKSCLEGYHDENGACVDNANQNHQKITMGYFHGCAITDKGQVRCWGSNSKGELGDQTINSRHSLDFTSDQVTRYVSVSAGGSHTCGLTVDGVIKCWGENTFGQVGDGSTVSRSIPTPISDLEKYIQVAAGIEFTCGLTTERKIKCWGKNSVGQLGLGSQGSKDIPTPIDSTDRFKSLSVGDAHACALKTSGQLVCWGFNYSGQLGDGSTQLRESPVSVIDGIDYRLIQAGFNGRTCGIDSSSIVRCWGFNGNGQLGDGTIGGQRIMSAPVTGGVAFSKISTHGVFHNCGIALNGNLFCWGGNGNGEIGFGLQNENRPSPTLIDSSETYKEVAIGWESSCGITSQGKIKCWGYSGYDSYGAGGATPTMVPTPVADSEGY